MNTEFWKGKTALVTGGTSGLGRALVEQLDQAGARVATIARRARPVGAHRTLVIEGDVSDKRRIHGVFSEALAHLGRIDLLVNNASSLGPTPLRLLLDTDCEDIEDVLQANLVGPFRLSKLAVAHMLLGSNGAVINVSSDAAVSAYPTWGAYSVSKAALDHLTRVFAAELEGSGVRFAALDPGDMDTPLHLAAIPGADRSKLNAPADSASRILAIAEGLLRGESAASAPIRRTIR